MRPIQRMSAIRRRFARDVGEYGACLGWACENHSGDICAIRDSPEVWMGRLPRDSAFSYDNKPYHKVRITKEFYLSTYACTQELYEAVTGENPSLRATNPVEIFLGMMRFSFVTSECAGGVGVLLCASTSPEEGRTTLLRSNGTKRPTDIDFPQKQSGSMRPACEEFLYAGSDDFDEVGGLDHKTSRPKDAQCVGAVRYEWKCMGVVLDSGSREYGDKIADPVFVSIQHAYVSWGRYR